MKRIRNIGFTGIVTILSLQWAALHAQPDTLCFNDTILYNIPGPPDSEYNWFVPGGSVIYSSARNDSVIIVWNVSTGLHSVEVTKLTENHCSSEPEILEVFVYQPVLDLGEDIEICEGSSEVLSIDPGYELYLWNNQPGFSEFVVNTAGILSLEVKDKFGCWSADSITVTENEIPKPDFTVNVDTLNRMVTVSNLSDTTWQYLWDFGDGTYSEVYNPGTHYYAAYGTYIITLTATAKDCPGTIVKEVILTEPVRADFIALVERCAPVEVTFINHSTGAGSYHWDFGNGNSSDEENPVTRYTEPGIYEVTLTAAKNNYTSVTRRSVIVNEAPVADFDVSPSETNRLEEIYFYNRSSNAVRYLWDFGDGGSSETFEPTHVYASTGIYDVLLFVWSEAGCSDSVRVNGAVTITQDCRIRFPSGFIPDKNGPSGGYYDPAQQPDYNTIFHPIYENVDGYELRIYNRWGEMVFVSTDITVGWDGYYKGRLAPQDTYIYEAKSKCASGEEIKSIGSVTLIY